MIGELEDEIVEMRAVVVRTGGYQMQKLESEKSAIQIDLKDTKDQLTSANAEISNFSKFSDLPYPNKQISFSEYLKLGKDNSAMQSVKITELEQKCKKSNDQGEKLQEKIKALEDKIFKQDNVVSICSV